MALTWPIELLLIMSGHLQWPSQMGVNLTTPAEGKIVITFLLNSKFNGHLYHNRHHCNIDMVHAPF